MSISNDGKHPFFDKYHDVAYIVSNDSRSIVSVCDKKNPKRKYILHNDIGKGLVVYHIDGGLISSNDTDKCDYGIYTDDDWLILVELKGCGYDHALEQINTTIDLLIKSPLRIKRVCARTVCSHIPKASTTNTKEVTLLKKLKTLNGTFEKKSVLFEEKLSKV